jgi:hypothetical protein
MLYVIHVYRYRCLKVAISSGYDPIFVPAGFDHTLAEILWVTRPKVRDAEPPSPARQAHALPDKAGSPRIEYPELT